MRKVLSAAVVAVALMSAATANAASVLFQFDMANSSISVTENGRACLPSFGCALSASLAPSFGDLTIDEGASKTFNFANFNVSPGFGGDLDARVEAVIAFTTPLAGPASTGGTGTYLRLGGFFHPGALAGTLVWDDPVQQLTALDGSVFTVQFGNIAGFTQGGYAVSPLTITVNSAAAVPEPATWALLIGGFGLTGAALRRRRTALAAFA